MKLSFSFAKSAAPKRTVIPLEPPKEDADRRQVIEISGEAGVVTEKSPEDIESESGLPLIIPCRTSFVKVESEIISPGGFHDADFKRLENQAGIITGQVVCHRRTDSHETTSGVKPVKKQRMSILMQIREAKSRGEIKDAPDQEIRTYDPDDFGWAVLRGMGYDESKDEGLGGRDVTKDVIGNRNKLGIGVKLESISLPTDHLLKKRE
jgi:hypothetical protein